MKNLSLALLAISLIFTACKKSDPAKSEDDIINGSDAISSDEFSIATSICVALKIKRLRFEQYGDGEKAYPFRVTSNICSAKDDDISVFESILRVPIKESPYFQGPGVDLFVSEIETDTKGLLENICDEVEKGNSIVKVDDQGAYRDRHDFSDVSGFKRYQITRYFEEDGKWKASRLTKIAVVTSDNDYTGMIKERVSESLCQNGKASSVIQYLRL